MVIHPFKCAEVENIRLAWGLSCLFSPEPHAVLLINDTASLFNARNKIG
jgi:hypothetical protein